MKVALVETIVGTGGHEVEHDRQIIEGLKALGHEVVLYIPENAQPPFDYKIPVEYLPGEGVSYAGIKGMRKIWLSIKREINRLRWYKFLYQQAVQGNFDAILFPTATHRFFRSLNQSILRNSPVPVVFCVIGVTPEEGTPFFSQAEKLIPYKNIKIVVISLLDKVLGRMLPNVTCIKPCVYAPWDLPEYVPMVKKEGPIQIGFFGQYRQEKKMEDFLTAFTNCRFTNEVQLVVQTVAIKPADIAALEAVKIKYQGHPNIRFFDKAVYGKEWHAVISQMDAIIIPYGASRFRYHGSGMLLTALGLFKPVVIADEVWPELLDTYQIGLRYSTGDIHALQESMECFVNQFYEQAELYLQQLTAANEEFSPQSMGQKLVELMQKDGQ